MSKMLLVEYHQLCPNGVCDITMLTEEEKKMKSDGSVILTGILQTADKKNQNGRIYPLRTLQREVENYQKLIKERRATGTLDHESTPEVSLAKVSHLVLRTEWKGNDLWGVIKILNTPCGIIAKTLIQENVQLGISSRALGSLREGTSGKIVEEDLSIISFDLVQDPSNFGSYMNPMLENKRVNIEERKLFSKADRIYRALNDILRDK